MTSLADDLIKTRSIRELRSLVTSLEKDAVSKKTELQQMVGSKYHDFIQSADKISAMTVKTDLIEQKISEFSKCNEALVSKSEELLRNAAPTSKNTESCSVLISSISDLNCGSIWSRLHSCDIFSSGALLLVAHVLLKTPKKRGRLMPTPSIAVQQFLQSSLLTQISSLSISNHLVKQLRAMVFLSKTIADDSVVVLRRDPRSSALPSSRHTLVEDKAKALACASFFTNGARGIGAIGVSKLDSLATLLSNADLRIGQVLSSRLSKDHSASDYERELSEEMGLLVQTLQHIIMDVYLLFFQPQSLLQHDATGRDKSLSTSGLVPLFQTQLASSAAKTLGSFCRVNAGNTADFEVKRFLEAVEGGVEVQADCKQMFQLWVCDVLRVATEHCTQVLNSLGSTTEVAQLQQHVWRLCAHYGELSKHTYRSSESSNSLYSQANWELASACLLTPRKSVATKVSPAVQNKLGKLRQGMVEAEGFSVGLLTQVSVLGGQAPGLILWASTFRVSFLRQVERLLRQSCEEVLRQTRRRLLRALEIEGVVLHPETLAVMEVRAVGAGADSRGSSTRLYRLAETIRAHFELSISKLLSDIVSPVYEESPSVDESPSQDTAAAARTTSTSLSRDGNSSGSLSNTLRTHCAQLVGQTMLLLRECVEACRDGLKSRGALHSTAEDLRFLETKVGEEGSGAQTRVLCPELGVLVRRSARSSGQVTRATVLKKGNGRRSQSGDAPEQALSTGLLLLGRVAWLFLLRGDFLHEALESRERAGGEGGAEGGYLEVKSDFPHNSEEQFQSAFEIADTDGDGIISLQEATEAIAGLTGMESFSLVSTPAGDPNSSLKRCFPGLSTQATSSFTYEEFTLVCGPLLLSPTDFRPVSTFHRSLDLLLGLAHATWALATVQRLGTGLLQRLTEDLSFYGIDALQSDDRAETAVTTDATLQIQSSSTSRSKTHYGVSGRERVKAFKVTWTACAVDAGDSEDAGLDAEEMLVPSSSCGSLAHFLAGLNQQLSRAAVSIDCVQALADIEGVWKASRTSAAAENDVRDEAVQRMSSCVTAMCGRPSEDPLVIAQTRDTPSQATLAYMVSRLTTQLSMAYVYSTYQSLHGQVTKTSARKEAADWWEDTALQATFDLLVVDSIASAWCIPDEGSSVAFSRRSASAACWRNHLDPITAELVLPLVQRAARRHMLSSALLLPRALTVPLTDTRDNEPISMVAVDSQKLLGRIFPCQTTGPARFHLLPLAVSAAPSLPDSETSQADQQKDESGPSANSTQSGVGALPGTLGWGMKGSTAPTDKTNNKSALSTGIKWW